MPKYLINAPDGRQYEVNTPEGTPIEQAYDYVRTQLMPRYQQAAQQPATPAGPKDTGLLDAVVSGLASSVKQVGQTAQAVTGGKPTPEPEEAKTVAEQPMKWGDLLHPGAFTEKALYGLASSAPEMVAGALGSSLGGGALAETGPGAVLGAAVGAGVGAGAVSTIKALGPYYAQALKEHPDDPQAAMTLATKQALDEGAISAASFALFKAIPFKKTLTAVMTKAFGENAETAAHIASQALAVQPAISATGQATQNLIAGRPAGEGLGEAYPADVLGTLTPMLGTHFAGVGAKRAKEATLEALTGSKTGEAPPPPTNKQINPAFDALVEKYKTNGNTEADAWKLAGNDLASLDFTGAGNVAGQPDIGGGKPSVPDTGGRDTIRPTGEPGASEAPGLGSTSAGTPGVEPGEEKVRRPLTPQEYVDRMLGGEGRTDSPEDNALRDYYKLNQEAIDAEFKRRLDAETLPAAEPTPAPTAPVTEPTPPVLPAVEAPVTEAPPSIVEPAVPAPPVVETPPAPLSLSDQLAGTKYIKDRVPIVRAHLEDLVANHPDLQGVDVPKKALTDATTQISQKPGLADDPLSVLKGHIERVTGQEKPKAPPPEPVAAPEPEPVSAAPAAPPEPVPEPTPEPIASPVVAPPEPTPEPAPTAPAEPIPAGPTYADVLKRAEASAALNDAQRAVIRSYVSEQSRTPEQLMALLDKAAGKPPTAEEVAKRGAEEGAPKAEEATGITPPTEEQAKNAQDLAEDLGGSVVYQNGDIGLIRGYRKDGQPAYVPFFGKLRGKVDIDNYTGTHINEAQKAELRNAKLALEDAAAKKHAYDPFVKYDEKGLAVSQSISKDFAGVIAGWKDLIVPNVKLYVTTVADALANRGELTGPERAAGTAALNPNELGSARYIGNNTYYIALEHGENFKQVLETLGHELGHIHEKETLSRASPSTQAALRADHLKWLSSQIGKSARELVDSLRAYETGKTTKVPEGLPAEKAISYWRSFSEYYADQVSRWAVSDKKPVSVVEKFFADIGAQLRKFYQTLRGQGYLPTETFRKYINETTKNLDLTPTEEPSRESLAAKSSVEPQVAQAQKVAEVKSKAVEKAQDKVDRSHSGGQAGAALSDFVKGKATSSDTVNLLNSVWDATSAASKRFIVKALTTDDITRAVGEQVKNLPVLNKLVGKLEVMRYQMLRDLAGKIPAWKEFNMKSTEGGKLLADLMHKSTLLNVDPTAANRAAALQGKSAKRRSEINDIHDMWDKLGTYRNGDGQKVYKMALESYRDIYQRQKALLKDKIANSALEGDIENPESEKGKRWAELNNRFNKSEKDVYFPLMRYGKYWFRIGNEYAREFYMFESAVDRNMALRNRVEELQKAGDARSIEKMKEDLDIDLGDSINDLRNKNVLADPDNFLKNILDKLDGDGVKDIEGVKDLVTQMYLAQLPERHILTRQLHRKEVTGFGSDALRNYVVSMHTAANQLSRLTYADQIRNTVGQAYAELAGNPKKNEIMPFVDEMAHRASAQINPIYHDDLFAKIANLGSKVAFLWMLTAPKSALINWTQLPIVGLPLLSARYGADKTLAMAARHMNLFNVLSTVERDAEGNVTNKWAKPSIKDSGYILNNPDVGKRGFLSRLWQHGDDHDVFGSTYMGDLSGRTRVSTASYDSPISSGARAVYNFMTGGFHHLERINRETMFMSAGELEFDKAKAAGFSDKAAEKMALDKAMELTHEAMFNFSQYNKPTWFRGSEGKLAFQFMYYPLQMASYLVRNFYNMLPYLNKEGKKEAATKLFGTLGMTWMFAGTVGLPMYGVVMGLAEGLRNLARPGMNTDAANPDYDDDDQGNPLGKRSLDLWFKESFLPNHFGPGSNIASSLGLSPEQAELLTRGIKIGPISALTDLNLSALSLDHMFSKDDTPAQNAKTAIGAWFLDDELGPLGGLMMQTAGAWDDLQNGRGERAFEKMLPAFFKGPVVAMRLAHEGSLTPQGAEIRSAEWYTTGKLLAQSLNFGSATVADIQESNILAKRIVAQVDIKRTQLMNQYNNAYQTLNRDPSELNQKTLDDVQNRIDIFNYKNAIPPLMITGKILAESIANKNKEINTSENGMVAAKELRPYIFGLLGNRPTQ